MSSWRSRILGEFAPGMAPVTLVADPDGLLLEEDLLARIRERGFELIRFEDPVTFRYAYESGIRRRRDRGEQVELVVVVHSSHPDIDALPYDLLECGRWLSFSIADSLQPRPTHFSGRNLILRQTPSVKQTVEVVTTQSGHYVPAFWGNRDSPHEDVRLYLVLLA